MAHARCGRRGRLGHDWVNRRRSISRRRSSRSASGPPPDCSRLELLADKAGLGLARADTAARVKQVEGVNEA